MSASHEDLFERLSTLVVTDRGMLVGVGRAEGLTAEEALECVQDALCTFLSRSENERSPTDDAAMRASLVITTRNAARNVRRLHRRALPHAPIEPAHEPMSDAIDVEELVAHAEEVVRLRLCVAELCSIQRAAVTLRLLEERSGEDVADALGVTRNHVDVLVHRAKGALRICMREDAPG
jgi:RNA polymerase sigma-70 factor, ECF subfamily